MFGIKDWIDPVEGGRITSNTGARKAFTTQNGNKASSYHLGLDIGKAHNAPIKAAFGGTVVKAGWINGYGKVVVVRGADGTYAQYAHLNDFSVKEGQTLKAGEQLGRMGSTGNSTGAHLDLIVSRNGMALDVNGKPHAKTKSWLMDNGAPPASYVAHKGLGGTPNAVDEALKLALTNPQILNPFAGLTVGETAEVAQSNPQENIETQTDTKPLQNTSQLFGLKNSIDVLADSKTESKLPLGFAQRDDETAEKEDTETDSGLVKYRDWITGMQSEVERLRLADEQEEAIQKMFEYKTEPTPTFGAMPDGVRDYMDLLIQKA